MGCCGNVFNYWRKIVLVVTPIALLPLVTSDDSNPSMKCAYVVLLMAIYWMTEALPMAVTSLLPVVLFPLFGIMSTNAACIQYLKETNMMFLGGLIVALAVENCGLHSRIALRVLLTVGTSAHRLIIGFMLTTMFLSMWISNTATTAMMMPITEAVLEELFRIDMEMNADSKKKNNGGTPSKGMYTVPTCETTLYDSNDGLAEGGGGGGCSDGADRPPKWKTMSPLSLSNGKMTSEPSSVTSMSSAMDLDEYEAKVEAEKVLFRKTVTLSVAYSANCGGIGTMSGSGPNLVLKGMLTQMYGTQTGLNFATWMVFCVPTMLLCVVGAWAWLLFLYTCRRPNIQKQDNSKLVKNVIQRKHEELGSMSFHETATLALFIILVILWFFREPQFIPGWAMLFPKAEVDDATAAIFISILLFVVPSKLNFWPFKTKGSLSDGKPAPALLEWSVIHKKMPWGILLLLGGGFSMAEGTKVSGLSYWVGQQLLPLNVLSPAAITFIVCCMTAAITEVTSNVAAATVLLPVLANLAQTLEVHPLYLMFPATITCSFAFMLPIATPPNAIAFTSGKMKSQDMLFPGIFMNILCVGVITLMINTLGVYLFDLHHFPEWARLTEENSTLLTTIMTTTTTTMMTPTVGPSI